MAEPVKIIEVDSSLSLKPARGGQMFMASVREITKLAPGRVLMVGGGFLVIASYANSLSGGFVYDDHRLVLAYPLLGHYSVGTLKLIFTSDYWGAYNMEQAGEVADSLYYRPFYHLFEMLAYSLAGKNP